MRRALLVPYLVAPLLLAGCAPSLGAERAAPAPEREFRGMWMASVSNIDWPSRPGLPADSRRAELVRILDRARALNLNAVILQVRPGADALYASPHEPWSEYLTGGDPDLTAGGRGVPRIALTRAVRAGYVPPEPRPHPERNAEANR